jgi:hypothetical protein
MMDEDLTSRGTFDGWHGDEYDIEYTEDELYDMECQEADLLNDDIRVSYTSELQFRGVDMSNIAVLEQIVELIEAYLNEVKDKYVRCAFQATLIKYRKELEDAYHKNALDVVEHKIAHLVKKLK